MRPASAIAVALLALLSGCSESEDPVATDKASSVPSNTEPLHSGPAKVPSRPVGSARCGASDWAKGPKDFRFHGAGLQANGDTVMASFDLLSKVPKAGRAELQIKAESTGKTEQRLLRVQFDDNNVRVYVTDPGARTTQSLPAKTRVQVVPDPVVIGARRVVVRFPPSVLDSLGDTFTWRVESRRNGLATGLCPATGSVGFPNLPDMPDFASGSSAPQLTGTGIDPSDR